MRSTASSAPCATHRVRCLVQPGGDLGARSPFRLHCQGPLLLIGTDCPALRPSHLRKGGACAGRQRGTRCSIRPRTVATCSSACAARRVLFPGTCPGTAGDVAFARAAPQTGLRVRSSSHCGTSTCLPTWRACRHGRGTRVVKRLLLLGGGHAHVKVLADLAERPLAGWDVGHALPPSDLLGHAARLDSATTPAKPARFAAGRDVCARGRPHSARRPAARSTCSAMRCTVLDGSGFHFDLLSIDTGPIPALDRLPGAEDHALPIRPIEGFVAAWPALVDRILALPALQADHRRRRRRRGRTRLRDPPARADRWLVAPAYITLVGSDEAALDAPARRERAPPACWRGVKVNWLGRRRAVRIESDRIEEFVQGDPLGFDACLVVTGAAAPAWPRGGLATDDRGFIRVGPNLPGVSHHRCWPPATSPRATRLGRGSGVYAVRPAPCWPITFVHCAGAASHPGPPAPCA